MGGVDWNWNATEERYWKKKKRIREILRTWSRFEGRKREICQEEWSRETWKQWRGGYLKCCATGKVSNGLIIFFIARCDWGGKKKIKITCGFVIGWIGTLNIYSIFIPPVWLLINVFDAFDDTQHISFRATIILDIELFKSICTNNDRAVRLEG